MSCNLELLVAARDDPWPGTTILLPQLPGAGAEELAAALLDRAPWGRRRVLPAPSPAATPCELRAWHRDAWLAMSEPARSSVALATGSTAAYLAPVADGAETVVLVRDAVAAQAAVSALGLPKKRTLEALAASPDARLQARLRPWSNPQSRALLAPWCDTDDLTVSTGPPADADDWRARLFEEVLPRVRADPDPVAVARAVAQAGGIGSKRAFRVAAALAESAPPEPLEPEHEALLRSLSWLDAELHERSARGRRFRRRARAL